METLIFIVPGVCVRDSYRQIESRSFLWFFAVFHPSMRGAHCVAVCKKRNVKRKQKMDFCNNNQFMSILLTQQLPVFFQLKWKKARAKGKINSQI